MGEFASADPTAATDTQREKRLAGRVALVTGASRGLGRFFAEVLAREGAQVILTARTRALLDDAAQSIIKAGGAAHAVDMDVTDPQSITRAFARAIEVCDTPTIIVNNAGVAEAVGTLKQEPPSFDKIIDTNLRGPWLVAREAAACLTARQIGGTIINIASILGLRQAGDVTAYASAKAGLIQMTKQLALEWARHDIRVNALAPGYIETDLNRDFFATERGAAMVRRIPMRKLVQLADLVEPFMLLAGNGSRFMTGAVIPVDGGHLLTSL